MEIKNFTITTPHDVASFFVWIVFERGVAFHPDDPFSDYISLTDGARTFTDEEAAAYDRAMELCFDVCERYGRDIYEIAGMVLSLYHYCDCNDAMSRLFFNEKAQ